MKRTAPRAPNGTADRILDVAERLVQTQGFNGFSYADIADDLGITKASLHYHFATKAALGARLIARYGDRFNAALDEIDRVEPHAHEKLRRHAQLYADVLKKNRMCLCGMMAAEHATLPREMRAGVRAFFETSEAWLTGVLEQGRKARQLRFTGAASDAARMLLGALEGAMLVARSYGELSRFTAASARLLADLEPAAGRRLV
jgi:TetR/AcrR family transcriptional regulator, transcriptional repressor for nem operon